MWHRSIDYTPVHPVLHPLGYTSHRAVTPTPAPWLFEAPGAASEAGAPGAGGEAAAGAAGEAGDGAWDAIYGIWAGGYSDYSGGYAWGHDYAGGGYGASGATGGTMV